MLRISIKNLFFLTILIPFTFPGGASAADLFSVCSAETGRSPFRLTASAAANCGLPPAFRVKRLVLDYEFTQGGNIYVQGVKLVSFPPGRGVKTGRMNISPELASGSSINLWVDAVNGVKAGGIPDGELFGRASLEFWGVENTGFVSAPRSSAASREEVRYPYPPGPDFSWLSKDMLKINRRFAFKSNVTSTDSQRLAAGASHTVGRMPWYLQILFIISIAILFVASYFYYRYGKSKRLIKGGHR